MFAIIFYGFCMQIIKLQNVNHNPQKIQVIFWYGMVDCFDCNVLVLFVCVIAINQLGSVILPFQFHYS